MPSDASKSTITTPVFKAQILRPVLGDFKRCVKPIEGNSIMSQKDCETTSNDKADIQYSISPYEVIKDNQSDE